MGGIKPKLEMQGVPAEAKAVADFIRHRMNVLNIPSQQALADRLGYANHTMVNMILNSVIPRRYKRPQFVPIYDIDRWADGLKLTGPDRDWFHEQVALCYTDDWFREHFAKMKRATAGG